MYENAGTEFRRLSVSLRTRNNMNSAVYADHHASFFDYVTPQATERL